jgi:hypothetical protein
LPHADSTEPSSDIKRSYARVLIVWAVTLLALYAFQGLFS